MDEKNGLTQMETRFVAEPADDFHAAINLTRVDELFPPEVVIEMNLVPRLDQTRLAFRDCSHPDGFWIFDEKRLGPNGIVIQKQETS